MHWRGFCVGMLILRLSGARAWQFSSSRRVFTMMAASPQTQQQTFRTEVLVDCCLKDAHKLQHGDAVTLIGSCFSDNIGRKMARAKFDVQVNPHTGTTYNPVTISKTLKRLLPASSSSSSRGSNDDGPTSTRIEVQEVTEQDLEFNTVTGLYCHLDYHSSFSSTNAQACARAINEAATRTRKRLMESSHVFITLGTAWVYTHRGKDSIVGNCHKLHPSLFERRLLPVEEVVRSLRSAVDTLAQLNPSAHVTFTVSPVRHWKEGAVGSNRSKAHLLAAVGQIVDEAEECARAASTAATAGAAAATPPTDGKGRGAGGGEGGQGGGRRRGQVTYFPSYEIVMDDLRDYRFYERDLLHPNEQAVDYIWGKFVASYLATESRALLGRVEALVSAVDHRPFNPHSPAHQQFLQAQLRKIDALEKERIRGLDLSEEKQHFESSLAVVP